MVITGGAGRVTTVKAADGTLVTPDTVWVAVRWYRPGGPMTLDEVREMISGACLRVVAA